MKFVALALAILLAVGSQAAPMMADAPTQLQQYRDIADMYLIRFLETIRKALDAADDPEMNKIRPYLDIFYTNLKKFQSNVSPFTDSIYAALAEPLTGVRDEAKLWADNVQAEAGMDFVRVKEVLDKHIQEYKTLMQPVMDTYREKYDQEKVQLQDKLRPLITALTTNVEETREALVPLMAKVRAKVAEGVESVRNSDVMTSYIEEYKEQLKSAYEAPGISDAELDALKEKITGPAQEIKNNLDKIVQIVAATFMKS